MSVQRGYGLNGKSIYTNIAQPTVTWLQFTVNSSDTGGLGVTSVKSNGYVEYVFMHTSATAGKANGFLNPNPAAGYALIGFKSNFNTFINRLWDIDPPSANTSTTSTTQHSVYTITGLGTATLAQWQAAGLPPGFTPTVGQTFVATATGTIGGSATVGTPGVPLITSVNVVGDPNQLISNANIAPNAGSQIVLQFAASTNSSTTTLVATAPADSSIVRLGFVHDRSSVTIDGL